MGNINNKEKQYLISIINEEYFQNIHEEYDKKIIYAFNIIYPKYDIKQMLCKKPSSGISLLIFNYFDEKGYNISVSRTSLNHATILSVSAFDITDKYEIYMTDFGPFISYIYFIKENSAYIPQKDFANKLKINYLEINDIIRNNDMIILDYFTLQKVIPDIVDQYGLSPITLFNLLFSE